MAIVALVMLLTSCAKYDSDAQVNQQEALVSLCVNAPTVNSRYGEGQEATTLQWAVYEITETGSKHIATLDGEKEFLISTSIDLKLIQGRQYDVLFWAKGANAPYTIDWEAKTMTVNYQNLAANQESYDAFYKYESLGLINGAINKSLELTRPFAQLNIATGDTAEAAAAKLVVEKTAISVANVYSKLNLADGTVSDEVKTSFTLANRANGSIVANGNEYDQIAMNYLLVGEKKLVGVELTINDEGLTRTYASVPVQRNYRTNIIGNILTSVTEFDIIVVPDWQNPDNIYNGNIIIEKAEVASYKSGGEEVVAFTSEEDWTVEVITSTVRSSEDWCSVYPTSGNAGDAEITITTQPNDTDEDRSATIVIQAGEDTQEITVTQFATAKPADPNPVPNNQIWYTSTDGNILEPNNPDAFGATIVSNTYENGKGVITFDGNVTEIGYNAFYNCFNLQTINIPDSITSIGRRAFHYCEKLTSITIPENVTSVGEEAFYSCKSLSAFYGKGASADNRSLIIDGVMISFAPGNYESTSYTIPEGVTTIGKNAFATYKSLTEIIIPEGVTTIGYGAFGSCSISPSITIPESVTTIDRMAFRGCKYLTTITIPKNVATIDSDAFDTCTSLTEVYCKSTTPPSIGYRVFRKNADDRKIYVPAEAVEDYKEAEGWNEYADYIFAENAPQTPANNQIWYTSTDGNIVTPYDTNVFGAAIVSNTYENGKGVITFDGDVTEIGDYAFAECSTLTSLAMPDSVKRIKDCSFWGNTALVDIKIGNGVTEIGSYAFYLCENLLNIVMPNSVTTIGSNLFHHCYKLQSITFSDNLTTAGEYLCMYNYALTAFYGKSVVNNHSLILDGVLKSIAPRRAVTKYTIPDNVTTIESGAIWENDILQEIIIPNSVTTIKMQAFTGCYNIESITIPESVTSIAVPNFQSSLNLQAFYGKFASADNKCLIDSNGVLISYALGCEDTVYTIPDGVKIIGNQSFQAHHLTNITIPESVISIGWGAFTGYNDENNPLNVYCKPATPPTIDNNVFYNAKIYVPAAVVEDYKAAWSKYADYIFADTSSDDNEEETTTPANNQIFYTSTDGNIVVPNNPDAFGAAIASNTYKNGKGVITFEGNVTEIGKQAFNNNTTLASLHMPDSAKSIGVAAFRDCHELIDIKIGNGVTEIARQAFYFCKKLPTIVMPNSVTTIGNNPFHQCYELQSVTFSDNLTSVGNYLFMGNNSLSAFYGNLVQNNCLVVDGVLKAFAPQSPLTEITIPDNVTTVESGAFWGCVGLQKVTIPNGVTTLNAQAFNGCNGLQSVTIPNSMEYIGIDCFAGCHNIKAFYGKFASADNKCLIINGTLVRFANGCGETNYTIPNDVNRIEDGAFNGRHILSTITIPASVTSIGTRAFFSERKIDFYFKSSTPASLGNDVFCTINDGTPTIYVPKSSVADYKAAWANYANYIFADPSTEGGNDGNDDNKYDSDKAGDPDYAAKIGNKKYTSLKDALVAVEDNQTITLLNHYIISRKSESLYFPAVSFTLDLNGYKIADRPEIGNTSGVSPHGININLADDSDNNESKTYNIKNGYLLSEGDAGLLTISGKNENVTATLNLDNVTIKRGESKVIHTGTCAICVDANIYSVVNINSGTTFISDMTKIGSMPLWWMVIHVYKGTLNIYEGAKFDYINATEQPIQYVNVGIGQTGGSVNTGVVNVYGGYGRATGSCFKVWHNGGLINFFGGEWIGNSDGTLVDNIENESPCAVMFWGPWGYDFTQRCNIYGGTFRGSIHAGWDRGVGLPTEMFISGGNFNCNPTAHLVEGHTATQNSKGIWVVE